MKLTVHEFLKNNKKAEFKTNYSSIFEKIQSHSEKHPEKDAIISTSGTKISYKQLIEYITQTKNLLKKNIQKNENIALLMENEPELLILNWTSWSFGYQTTPLDIKRDTFERKIYKLKLTKTKILFARMDQISKTELQKIQEKLPEITIIPIRTTGDFLQKIQEESSKTHNKKAKELSEKTSLILFTSGTTALPKGAELTPRSLCADAEQIIDWLKITEQDRFHILLPLHHINSTTFSLATILAGGSIILSPKYSKSKFWNIMSEHQVTISSIVPTIAYDLLSEKESFQKNEDKLRQITRIQIGSAPVQPKVVEEFWKQYNIKLIQGYGSTETSLRCTGIPFETTDKQYEELIKNNSIGIEMKNDNVTILDSKGKECKENEEGEICVRGPMIMNGYLKNQEATDKAFIHDWFHTGDAGIWKDINNEKFFFIKGRIKEIIIKGGVNISPLSIENTILKNYPKIHTCYCIGFPDERFGEEIGLIIDGEKQEIQKLKEDIGDRNIKNINAYEQPKTFLHIDRETLPKTSTGKIQRIKIKEQYKEKLKKQSSTITQTKEYTFRKIFSEETQTIQEAVEIHNSRWLKNLQTDKKTIQKSAKNGILVGVFDIENTLQGIVSALKLPYSDLKEKKPYTQTWDGITSNGTLEKHNERGDCLVCVSISVQKNPSQKTKKSSQKEEIKKEKLTSDTLQKYLDSKKDPVISFHQNPKAGFQEGAKIINIFPNGRPKDDESLGYNILLKYPKPTQEPKVNPEASLGTQLIEAALLFAYQEKIPKVIAYSKPATLSKFFTK